MTRVLLIIGALAAWAAMIAVSLFVLTPHEEQAIAASAGSELQASMRTLAVQAGEMIREQLAATREAAQVLRPGALLETPEAAAPAKGKKKAVTPATEAPTDALRTLEADLGATFGESGRWWALVNAKGEVTLAGGEGGWAAATPMRNHPLIADGLAGISRASAAGAWLLTSAPTVGRDGSANGVLVLARAVDTAFCAELSRGMAETPVAIGMLCKTGNMPAVRAGMATVVQPLDAPLLFVDTKRVGTLVYGADHALPVLDLPAAVGKDLRPAYTQLSAWQQRLAAVWLMGLIPLLLLIGLAWMMAAAPAQAIANHLALVQQGSKVAPLAESRFSGGFKRVVKNLNALLERRDLRPSPQSLAPISQLLQQQTDDSQELTLDTLKEVNRRPAREPEVAPPMPAPSPEPAPLPPSATRPPLQPLPSGLSALSESIFEEDKTSKSNAISRREPPPAFDEPPPPPPAPTMRTLDALSDIETDGALPSFVPRVEAPVAKPAPFPEPPPPEETPWPESTAAVPPPAATPADPDEAHFQEVFQQFLKVREQCGEPTNNLTYDKFVEKLRKSRDQVVQKQNTRNVRFQVYVKDGKAALKAVAAGRAG